MDYMVSAFSPHFPDVTIFKLGTLHGLFGLDNMSFKAPKVPSGETNIVNVIINGTEFSMSNFEFHDRTDPLRC